MTTRRWVTTPSLTSPISRPRYRLQQFWRALHAQIQAEDLKQVALILPEAAVRLFQQMPVDGQRHSLSVLGALQKAGYRQPDLAGAALLHDVGKVAAEAAGYRLGLWWRGPLVLFEAAAPTVLDRLAAPNRMAGWRYLLYVHRQHPAIGAAWAEAAGCSSRTCWFIAHHQDQPLPPADSESLALLQALQWADGKN